jgi:hypothetical protein
MTLSVEQFHEQLIDYLYDQLKGDELRAFEAHLRDSADARQELASLQNTLRVAREGIAQSADEAPTARVRDAVLAAARQHAREPMPAKRARDESAGVWRWLRAAWLLPTLGVVAAAAFVVFSKHALSPELTREGTAASPYAVTTPAAPPPSAANAAPANESKQLENKAERTADPQPSAAKPTRSSTPRARGANAGFALPPPAWAPAPAAAPRGSVERETGQSEDEPNALRRRAPTPSRGAEPLREAAKPEPADDLLAGSEDGRVAAANVLVRRASEHAAARRWREAQEDYRDLLRRFPRDVRTAEWRRQLAAALLALQHGGDGDGR